MIPFVVNDVTEACSPLKCFEYLGASLPVVTTALPEIKDEIKEEYTSVQPRMVNNNTRLVNAPAYTKAVDEATREKFDAGTTDDIDAKAYAVIEQHSELTQAQFDHAVRVSQAYHDITVNHNGKIITVDELLNNSPNDEVSVSQLDFLKDQVPDPSMLKSSVANFDTEYMNKFFLRDLVLELTAFNKVGMFLKDLKINDISDSMNNMLEVKATYEDVNHKKLGTVIEPSNIPSMKLHERIGFKVSHRVLFWGIRRKKDGRYTFINVPRYNI